MSRLKSLDKKHFLVFTSAASLIAIVGAIALISIYGSTQGDSPAKAAAAPAPPPAGGYFQLKPPSGYPGSLSDITNLPSDSQAASMVHHSTWEPRSANYTANHTLPTAGFTTYGTAAYAANRSQLFGRVTGNYTGTTDEIIQWIAAKWGLSDEIIRAEAVQESNWYQDN